MGFHAHWSLFPKFYFLFKISNYYTLFAMLSFMCPQSLCTPWKKWSIVMLLKLVMSQSTPWPGNLSTDITCVFHSSYMVRFYVFFHVSLFCLFSTHFTDHSSECTSSDSYFVARQFHHGVNLLIQVFQPNTDFLVVIQSYFCPNGRLEVTSEFL